MDMAAVTGAVTGLKAVKDLLQVALRTKVAVESAAQIGTALERLGEVQDKLFDLRDELFQLQQEKESLRAELKAREDWDARLAKYRIVTTPGHATVYEHTETPSHFVCPSCINEQKIQILQDRRAVNGVWECPGCKVLYPIEPQKTLPEPRASRSSYLDQRRRSDW